MNIALIACSAKKAKTEKPVPAIELYQGQLFQAQVAYTRQVLGIWDSRIFILSAQYGLVSAKYPLTPYDQSLPGMGVRERRKWGSVVAFQLGHLLGRLGIPKVIYVMGGRLYSDPIVDACEFATQIVVPHPSGLGYAQQVAWYKGQAEGET